MDMLYKVEQGQEIDEQKQEIKSYWNKRSLEFSNLRRSELKSSMAEKWLEQIHKTMILRPGMKVLDVGTGAGFFAILLQNEGMNVTAIDLSEEMIKEAQQLAEEYTSGVEFKVMDAEALSFKEETFDIVLARNVTWILPHPDKAYREWLRVLKPGGVLLNFDADYGRESFVKDKQLLPSHHAHHHIQDELLKQCEKIKSELVISSKRRPDWDVYFLENEGCKVCLDENISQDIYLEKDIFYNPAQMFRIRAEKR